MTSRTKQLLSAAAAAATALLLAQATSSSSSSSSDEALSSSSFDGEEALILDDDCTNTEHFADSASEHCSLQALQRRKQVLSASAGIAGGSSSLVSGTEEDVLKSELDVELGYCPSFGHSPGWGIWADPNKKVNLYGSCQEYGCTQDYRPHQGCQCNDYCRWYANCCEDMWCSCGAPRAARDRLTTTPPMVTPEPIYALSEVGEAGHPAEAANDAAVVGGPVEAQATIASNFPIPSPAPRPYRLKSASEGHGFFDGWDFLRTDANHGSAEFLSKDDAFRYGVVEAHHDHAILGAGRRSSKYHFKRHSAKIQSKEAYKYYLVTMKFSHVPYGCGVWPAFFTLGSGKSWPAGGEVDILEYVNMDLSKASLHVGGDNCTLDQQAVNKFGDMPDRNGMNYNCVTDYSRGELGCAPNKWMRSGIQWTENPGVVAMEWTEEHVKVFAIPESEIPKDLVTDRPRPESWDEWLFSYYPLAASDCSSHMEVPQHLLLQINFCGDWASKVWGLDQSCSKIVQHCRPVDPLAEYAPNKDCCTQYIWDEYYQYGTDHDLKLNAFFNISYIKVYQQT
eukprot:CAMPEP_0206549048 /NCGR_PEP_ID=MMETSP0325_2-20121206/14235_1 /ASSEMBLY_ACC=CAM_ASM_000347 /TAXON_ID=2866 /ORGANISM="Crypthecodinium cohnii, Strain Seligo" /LENGTH=563 /DNA_ID=CAMNT_0054048621 /DNA_START=73 /DNA_END=1768 /DNA_ORIENTATION=+